MRNLRLVLASSCLILSTLPGEALAKPVHLICRTDPDWPPPLDIMIDEDRGAVSLSGRLNSGPSPNSEFTEDSVVFGFAGSRFYIDRTNLTLITTSD
jgi:hypothetical protein